MGINVAYTDETTKEILFEDFISDEEVKARESDEKSIFEWESNMRQQKSRRLIDELVAYALGAGDEKIKPLSDSQKTNILSELTDQSVMLRPIKLMPMSVKRQIIAAAETIKAIDRNPTVLEA